MPRPTDKDLVGMKQREIAKCALCNRGMMHRNSLTFMRVTIERFFANLPAIKRQAWMEMMMGDCAPLAQIMGPDEDMAVRVEPAIAVLICDHCFGKDLSPLYSIMEDHNADDNGG